MPDRLTVPEMCLLSDFTDGWPCIQGMQAGLLYMMFDARMDALTVRPPAWLIKAEAEWTKQQCGPSPSSCPRGTTG